MNRTIARLMWWVATIALIAGIYIGLDHIAWFTQLPDALQRILRIASGVVTIALASTLDPWRQRKTQANPETTR